MSRIRKFVRFNHKVSGECVTLDTETYANGIAQARAHAYSLLKTRLARMSEKKYMPPSGKWNGDTVTETNLHE